MSADSSPVGHFRELTRALESEGDIPPDVVRWLHDACARFAAGDESTLCGALGLRGQGIELPANTYARQTRDAELIAAFALIKGRTRWDRCKTMKQQIRAFQSRTWPRVCDYAEPPARLTEVQRHLFAAFKAHPKVPASLSRLSEILR